MLYVPTEWSIGTYLCDMYLEKRCVKCCVEIEREIRKRKKIWIRREIKKGFEHVFEAICM